jgi:hypothetical protein
MDAHAYLDAHIDMLLHALASPMSVPGDRKPGRRA